jgi:hypothetical protein
MKFGTMRPVDIRRAASQYLEVCRRSRPHRKEKKETRNAEIGSNNPEASDIATPMHG